MALAAAFHYWRWRNRPLGSRLRLTHDQEHAVRARIRTWCETHADTEWLPFDELASLLARVGVRVAETRITAPDSVSASAAAQDIGFPVVLKAISPGLELVELAPELVELVLKPRHRSRTRTLRGRRGRSHAVTDPARRSVTRSRPATGAWASSLASRSESAELRTDIHRRKFFV